MADTKISADPNLASPAAGDQIPIVDIDVADSLKNKTVTWSQIVNTGQTQTITALKTFSAGIATDTISEETTAAGVTIDSVLIKDAVVTAGGVILNSTTGMYRDVNDEFFGISGGTNLATGANILLYGGTYASPSRILIRDGVTTRLQYDAGKWDFTGNVGVGIDPAIETTYNSLAQLSVDRDIGISRWAASAAAPQLYFAKSRSETEGTHTIVQNNDSLGWIGFSGSDGVDFNTEGSGIFSQVDGTPAVGSVPADLSFWTAAAGDQWSTRRMTINSDGEVGIGLEVKPSIYNANAQLDVNALQSISRWSTSQFDYPSIWFTKSKSATPGTHAIVIDGDGLMDIVATGSDGVGFNTEAAGITMEVDGTPALNSIPGSLSFYTTPAGDQYRTQRMRIRSDGNVGIGESSPDVRVHVKDDTGAYSATNTDTNALLKLENSGNTDNDAVGISFVNHTTSGQLKGCAIMSERSSSTASELAFITSIATTPAERMRISSSGVVAIGTTDLGEGAQVMTQQDSGLGNIAGDEALISEDTVQVAAGTGNRLRMTTGVERRTSGSAWHLTEQFIRWQVDSSTNTFASIKVIRDSTTTTIHDMSFSVGGDVERMRLTSTGLCGISEVAPEQKLHVTGLHTDMIYFESTQIGQTLVGADHGGMVLRCGGMNTTSKYTPAYMFGSNDSGFSGTGNGDYLAGIVGRATEAYAVSTDGGMGMEFLTTPNGGGSSAPVMGMYLNEDGYLGIQQEPTNTVYDYIPKLSVNENIGINRWFVGTGGADINFTHSRHATIGSHTALNDNDSIAWIVGVGSDGTDFNGESAAIGFRADGAFSSNVVPGKIVFYTTAAASQWGTLNMTLDAAADLTLHNGSLILGTSGEGIDFSAATPDGTGTTGNEVLDDYEEGTWSPVISDNSAHSATMAIQVGTYVKIGKQVTCKFRFTMTNKDDGGGALSGSLRLEGLPFTSDSLTHSQGSMYIGYCIQANITVGESICGYLPVGGTRVLMRLWDGTGGNTDLQDTEIYATCGMMGTIHYEVA